MKKKALSIEEMRHLQELGLDISNASMCWCGITGIHSDDVKEWKLDFMDDSKLEHIKTNDPYYVPAYTLQDIIENLPDEISTPETWEGTEYNLYHPVITKHDASYVKEYSTHYIVSYTGSIYACYSLLCWILENKFITPQSQRIIRENKNYEQLTLEQLKQLIETDELPNETLRADLPKFIKESIGKDVSTTIDLIKLLPESIISFQWFYCNIFPSSLTNEVCYNLGYATYRDDDDLCCIGSCHSLLEALYKLVCWTIKNNYLKI